MRPAELVSQSQYCADVLTAHQFLVAPEFLLLRRRRAIGVSSVTAAPAKASTKLKRRQVPVAGVGLDSGNKA